MSALTPCFASCCGTCGAVALVRDVAFSEIPAAQATLAQAGWLSNEHGCFCSQPCADAYAAGRPPAPTVRTKPARPAQGRLL